MLTCELTEENIEEFLPLIPVELPGMDIRALHFIGSFVLSHPAGVLIWKENRAKGEGKLLSLFVDPEYRGIGAGAELFEELRKEMKLSGTGSVSVSYHVGAGDTKESDRLTSFLISRGCDLESVDIKTGYVYLDEALLRLGENKIDSHLKKTGLSLKKLPEAKRALVKNWIEDNLSIDSVPYVSDGSLSYAAVKDNELEGIILALVVNGQIRLDYLYTSGKASPVITASLIRQSADEAARLFSGDEPLIEAALQSESALKIWQKLFGEPSFSETYISGEYSPGKFIFDEN